MRGMDTARRERSDIEREGQARRRNPYLANQRTPQVHTKRRQNVRRYEQEVSFVQKKGSRTVVHQAQNDTPLRQRNSRMKTDTPTRQQNAQVRNTRNNQQMTARRLARQRRMRRIQMLRLAMLCGLSCIVVILGLLILQAPEVDGSVKPGQEVEASTGTAKQVQGISAEDYGKHPTWEEDFLTPNEYSRPGDPLTEVKNIFVHYTANPGTSAAQNRSYFEQQKDMHERSVSAHFIIGYEGEIILCVPLDEIAYAVQTRNEDSLSIECCYLASDGSFTQETYDSLILLLRWLIDTYDLDSDDILRHYDCGGKKCPIYYTENEDAWERLKKDVTEL